MDEQIPTRRSLSMPSTATARFMLRSRSDWSDPKPRRLRQAALPSFGEYSATWIVRQTDLAQGGLLRISSLHRSETALRAHLLPFFAARQIDQITRQHCDAFRIAAINAGRLNPGTVNSLVQILRLILRAAQRDGLIDRDPLAGMRPLRVARRLVDPYDRAEIERLLEATPPRERLVIALAALAGLRQGEVYAIRPCDIDRAGRRLRVRRSLQRPHPGFTMEQRLGTPKTAAGYREVPMQSTLLSVIDAHSEELQPASGGLLCPASDGGPHTPIDFHRRIFAPAIRAAGLRPMRFHDLRRSFIAQCVAARIPPAQTAAWLGHSIRMTEHY
jgi:integrase